MLVYTNRVERGKIESFLLAQSQQVSEVAGGTKESADPSSEIRCHLPHTEKESIAVTLHGATNLPSLQDGSKPWPYVIVKISTEEDKDWNAKTISPVSKEPTHSPTWETMVTVEIQEENIDCEDVILTVADHKTNEVLAAYRIPVKCLHVFQPYHFELVMVSAQDLEFRAKAMGLSKHDSGRINCTLPLTGVFLHGMTQPLKKSVGPIVVVVRVVTNYRDFVKVRLAKAPSYSGLPLTTLNFPSPSVMSFDVPRIPNQGCPQISLPGKPEEQPVWNSSFLFQGRDGATLFTEDTALVLEYYPLTTGEPQGCLPPGEGLGCSIPLGYRKTVHPLPHLTLRLNPCYSSLPPGPRLKSIWTLLVGKVIGWAPFLELQPLGMRRGLLPFASPILD
uniref:C2 domain-containing protein n=1 Tax=Ornithorhynchus anatinus TaxID=9258 RepID=A0A6I8NWF7_ORNAN